MTLRLSAVKSVRLVMAASIVPKHGEGVLGCSYMWIPSVGTWLARSARSGCRASATTRGDWSRRPSGTTNIHQRLPRARAMPGRARAAPRIVKCGCLWSVSKQHGRLFKTLSSRSLVRMLRAVRAQQRIHRGLAERPPALRALPLARLCHFRAHDRGKPAFWGHFRQFDHTRVRVRPLLSRTL